MIFYEGYFDDDGQAVRVWLVNEETGQRTGAPLNWRLDLVNHSPSGLSWGYLGSGPVQLGIALLAHALQDNAKGDDLAIRWGNDLARHFLARYNQHTGWMMCRGTLLGMLDDLFSRAGRPNLRLVADNPEPAAVLAPGGDEPGGAA